MTPHLITPLRRPTPGASPHFLLPQDEPGPTRLELLCYDDTDLTHLTLTPDEPISKLPPAAKDDGCQVRWSRLQGFTDRVFLAKISEYQGFHPLLLANALNQTRRPRLSRQRDYLAVSFPVLTADTLPTIPMITLVLGKSGWVFSFERTGLEAALFAPIVERLRHEEPHPLLREGSADFLFYALLDVLVDVAFPCIDAEQARLDELEEIVLTHRSVELSVFDDIQQLHRNILLVRKLIGPMREIVRALLEDNADFFEPTTMPYLHDTYHEILQLADAAELLHDTSKSVMDLFFSLQSHRLERSTSILSLIATLFLPATFIAGLYGMNFDPDISPYNMPETKFFYGYPMALGLMAASMSLMLLIFWRRRVLSAVRNSRDKVRSFGQPKPSSRARRR